MAAKTKVEFPSKFSCKGSKETCKQRHFLEKHFVRAFDEAFYAVLHVRSLI